METKKKLGEILISQGLITAEQLSNALEEQKKSKESLGEVLLRLGFIRRETDILVALSQQLHLPIVIGEQLNPRLDQRLHDLIPEPFARQHFMIPLSRTESNATVAFAYTFDPAIVSELKKLTGLDISPVLAKKSDLAPKLEAFYKSTPKESSAKDEKVSHVRLTDVKPTGRKLKLGEILVQQGLMTKEQLEEALHAQKKSGRPLGEVLVRRSTKFASVKSLPFHVLPQVSAELPSVYWESVVVSAIDFWVVQWLPLS